MLRIALVLVTCTVFTGCMTETDKALWQETVATVSGKTSSVAAEAPANAPAPATEAKEIKTAEASKMKEVEKEKEKEIKKTETSAPANSPQVAKPN